MNKKSENDEKRETPSTKIKIQDIPWLKIIQFHKEIVARAEDQFFALEGGSPNHKRWTSLENFNSYDSAGPWEINLNELTSDAFRTNLDQGAHESCFIGAACYRSDIKLQRQWTPRWIPLLYREVEVREEDGLLKVNPLASSWSLSPLFLGLLERLEIQPEEDLVQQLLGQVHGDNHLFSEQILRALFELYPDVRRDLTTAIPTGWNDKPSPWVLFAPTTVFGAFIRNLMADYNFLEKVLTQNIGNIGGLGVLDIFRPAELRKDIDLLPIVPLNSSQNQAAEAVFRGRSVTVISGPPGTGKSQVAVSVLLNAWAQGKKCLFVSNNNKAVNVVNDRLRKLQGGAPVVVRAGRAQDNTIVPDLTRILTLYAGAKNVDNVEELKDQISPLEKERHGLVEFLEARRGKEIDDLRKATFEAYQEYNSSVENIRKKKCAFDKELVDLGGARGTNRLIVEDAFRATQVWVIQFLPALRQRELEDQRREELNKEINVCEANRENILGQLDLVIKFPDNGHWLVDGIQSSWLFDWKNKLEVLLNDNINRVFALISCHSHFSDIHSSGDAQNTKLLIQSLSNDIDTWCVGLQNGLNEIEVFYTAYDASRVQVLSYGIMLDNVRCSLLQLEEWLEFYNEQVTRPSRWIDFVPFSRRRKLVKKLCVLDRKFRMSFPRKLFGDAPAADHEMMYPAIQAAYNWKYLECRAEEMSDKRDTANATHRKLKRRVEQFSFTSQHIPQTLVATVWENFIGQCHVWVTQLVEDEQLWKRVEEKKAFEAICRGLAEEWQNTVVSVPLLSRWAVKRGARFHGLMKELAVQPTKERLQETKLIFFDHEFSKLAENWNQAVLQQKQLEDLLKQRSKIPTAESRLQDWLDQKSSEGFQFLSTKAGVWPEKVALDFWLEKIRDCIDRQKKFFDDDLPNLESVSCGKYAEAHKKLNEALDSLPDGNQKTQLGIIVGNLVEPEEWFNEEIAGLLKDFGSDRIHATLSRLESRLQDLSLRYAQGLWMRRLRGDDEACEAVTRLRNSFAQNLTVHPNNFPLFQKALSLAPIWITTAQSSQSIPMESELFDFVMIDEATQCTLTNLLPLIYRGKTLVVLGDQNQLPPIFGVGAYDQEIVARRHGVESYLSSLGHYGKNVYSTSVKVLPHGEGDVVSLNQHYRSDPLVIGFSNREIYNQSLQLRKDPEWSGELPVASGMYKVHVGGIATRGPNRKSWINKPEADAVLEKVLDLKNQPSLTHKSIGIVTPFRAQKDLISNLLGRKGQSEVLVGTADTFQGDERDIMIFSPVVSRGMENHKGTINWIEDPHNRINVALTRARDANFIVGDFEVCKSLPGILGKLIEYCETIELLRENSPAELYLFSWMMIKGWTPIIQHPVADMRVDFYLKAKNGDRIAVEVDGKVGRDGRWIHSPHKDDARDEALRTHGYEPLHFPAKEVFQTPLTVIKKIEESLGS